MFGAVGLDVLRPAEEAQKARPSVRYAHMLGISRRQLGVEMIRVKTLVAVDGKVSARAEGERKKARR